MAEKRKITWNEFLMDGDGEFSFKRIFTAIFGLLYIFLFVFNLFTGKMVHERLIDTIDVVILASIGSLALESFSKRRTTTIVGKDAIVTQEASPLSSTSVTAAVDKIVEKATDGLPVKKEDKKEEEEEPKVMPEMIE